VISTVDVLGHVYELERVKQPTCSSVVLETQSISDAGGDGIDVLHRTGEFDTNRILAYVTALEMRLCCVRDRGWLTIGTTVDGTGPKLSVRVLRKVTQRTQKLAVV
jgi:hypothetical protein